jgi:outer membrane protein assembly factor BamE (lipoprotein component of BamABCDE complex)
MKGVKKRNSLKRYNVKSDCEFSAASTFRRFDVSTTAKAARHLALIIFRLVVVLLFLVEISCVGKRLRKANVVEVTEGMSKKQVESILGPPTNIDNKDLILLKRTIYVYHQGNDIVTIVFKDDKVSEKQSTLTD